MFIGRVILVGLLIFIAMAIRPSMAQDPEKKEKTDNLTLVVMPLDPLAKYDVSVMGGAEAMAKLKRVMALIRSKSRLSNQEIKRLDKAGQVILAYDPGYPKKGKDLAKVRIAGFSKDYNLGDVTAGKGRYFMAIIGRHGIKWPDRKLAAVVVHELVGHGIQHMEGRWRPKQRNDMECEAWLYESQAYADFGVDRLSSDMVRFQKQLSRYCSGFIRHLQKKDAKGLAAWKVLNRDVPKVLSHFRRYLNQ